MATELIQHVQQALNRLGDPAYLEVHPLAAAVPADAAGATPGARLRGVILAAIEQLRPADGTEGGAYALMQRRYLAGRSVVAVCHDLGLSESEYYRQHRRALAALAALIAGHLHSGEGGEGAPPAAPAAPTARTNLPRRPTGFVGRAGEIAECGRLLETTPLLTLVGAPGIGKTRLALAVAARALDQQADGVWLVELAALRDPALVPQAVAAALGVREGGGQDARSALLAFLLDRRLLLVLDDCEHLLEACAAFLEDVLQRCPRVRALATSREPLRAAGEVVYRVAPLPVPSAGFSTTPEQLEESPGTALFLARARAVDPAFAVSADDAEAIARICRRLDGIPLAIELAAARVGALTPTEIEARLADRFRILRAGRRDAPARHQTLGALLDWSHDLLTPPERALLRRLSVLTAPFDLAAAEAVGADGDVPAADVLDVLGRLVDRSLVAFDRALGRYRLHETVRAYATARLAESPEAAEVEARQRGRILALAEAAGRARHDPVERVRLQERLEAEAEDVRATLAWWRDEDPATGLRAAAGLWRLWWELGYVAEGGRWLAELLARTDGSSADRAQALFGAAVLARARWDFADARTFGELSLAPLRAAGDDREVALALHNLGVVAWYQGRPDEAAACLEEALALARRAGDQAELGMVLRDLGDQTLQRGRYDQAEELLGESLRVLRSAGDDGGVGMTLLFLGRLAAARGRLAEAEELHGEGLGAGQRAGGRWTVAAHTLTFGRVQHLLGDLDAARAWTDDALARFRRLEARRDAAWALRDLGDLDRAEDDLVGARALYDQSLTLARDVAADEEVGRALASAAEVARRQGELDTAARLAREAVEHLRSVSGVLGLAHALAIAASVHIDAGEPASGVRLAAAAAAADPLLAGWLCPDERAARDGALAAARTALGEAGFEAAWREGAGSPLADAARLVVGVSSSPTGAPT